MESTTTLNDFNVTDVKSDSNEYLQAKNFEPNKLLTGVVFIEPFKHELDREVEKEDGTKKRFKEDWIVKVEYDKKPYFLRLSKKMVVNMRTNLNFGADMTKWSGKIFSLVVIKYNTGNGFAVVV
jgi:hypothetical protein